MTLSTGLHDVPEGHIASVVTHLEMTARAPLRDVPQPKGLTFEPLPRDSASYRDLFRRVGQDWLWFSRLTMPDRDLDCLLNDPAITMHTLTRDGQPEALLELDFRDADACELAFFGLTKALIGTGAGAFLMDRAIELAWSRDISRLHVHTCTLDAPEALGFYQRSGFTCIRRQIEIAPDPRLSNMLPQAAAPQIPAL